MEIHIAYGDERFSLSLDDGEYLVGRSQKADIRIPVQNVSREHAILRVQQNRVFLRNRSRTTGTMVDGELLGEKEVPLPENRDAILGEARMWWGREGSTVDTLLSSDEDLESRLRLDPTGEITGTARDRIVTMLSSLFELLDSAPGEEGFENEACSFIGTVVHADRVILLEDDGPGTSLEQRAAWFSSVDHRDKVRLSTHLVERVRATGRAELVDDAQKDARYESVLALQIRNAMVAPLFEGRRVRGILYADNLIHRRRYGEEDLQVLQAISRAVGLKRRWDDQVQELARARRVQQMLLPRALPQVKGAEVLGHVEMSRDVGGDFFQILERPSGALLLAVGDVSGKGMAAALSMGATTMLLRLLARLGGEPSTVVAEIHEQLRETLPTGRFVTLFVGEYEPRTGKLLYVGAGHEPARIIRADGSLELLGSTTIACGMPFDAEPLRGGATLQVGDLLAVFTDGITEATPDGEEFYESGPAEGLLAEDQSLDLSAIRDALLKDIRAFLGGRDASDDITLVLLRRT